MIHNRASPRKLQLRGSRAAVLALLFFGSWNGPTLAQVDFPIGYSSLGGTYAFIALIEEYRLLEKDNIRLLRKVFWIAP